VRLIGHERVLADAVVRRQAEVRSARVIRIEARFGPAGVRLLAAAMATVVAGELIGIVGAAVLIGSITAGWVLIGVGAVLVALSSIRFVQAGRAGRDYRRSSR
jgi:hypothetical protein